MCIRDRADSLPLSGIFAVFLLSGPLCQPFYLRPPVTPTNEAKVWILEQIVYTSNHSVIMYNVVYMTSSSSGVCALQSSSFMGVVKVLCCNHVITDTEIVLHVHCTVSCICIVVDI